MKRVISCLLLVALLLTVFPMAAEPLIPRDKSKHLEILTVGNSMTYYNDLGKPDGILHKIAKSAGYDVTITALYKGGYSLDQFIDETDPYGKTSKPVIENGKFDIIIAQENGQIAASKAGVYRMNCRSYKKLADEMGAELFLYETYGPADDYKAIKNYGKDCLDAEMKTRANTEKNADEFGIKVAYAGAAFSKVLVEHPELELHYEDRLHPSEMGSILLGYTIFATVFGVDPTTVAENCGLPADTAKIFKEAASDVVVNGAPVDPAYSKLKKQKDETPAEEQKLPFTDVREGDWFYTYVKKLYEDGVISGMTDTTFVPNGTLTNGQALKLLICALANGEQGENTGHWASGYHAYAKEQGWLTADLDLDAPITRLSLCQIAAKAKKLTQQPAVNPFTDCADEAVLALVNAEIVSGMTETTFCPNDLLTRAQISKIIYLLKYL